MAEQSQSRRSFLYAAISAGVAGKAAIASKIRVTQQSAREFRFEGWPATEFLVQPHQLDGLGAGAGAVELTDPATSELFLAPLFDLSLMSEARFDECLRASVQAHGAWHQEQGRTPPDIHIHLVRIADHPNLRALLVHSRRCVLTRAEPAHLA